MNCGISSEFHSQKFCTSTATTSTAIIIIIVVVITVSLQQRHQLIVAKFKINELPVRSRTQKSDREREQVREWLLKHTVLFIVLLPTLLIAASETLFISCVLHKQYDIDSYATHRFPSFDCFSSFSRQFFLIQNFCSEKGNAQQQQQQQ